MAGIVLVQSQSLINHIFLMRQLLSADACADTRQLFRRLIQQEAGHRRS